MPIPDPHDKPSVPNPPEAAPPEPEAKPDDGSVAEVVVADEVAVAAATSIILGI